MRAVLRPQRMVEAGGGLERKVRRGARAEETEQLGGGREGVRRDAAGAHLGASAVTGDGGDEGPGIAASGISTYAWAQRGIAASRRSIAPTVSALASTDVGRERGLPGRRVAAVERAERAEAHRRRRRRAARSDATGVGRRGGAGLRARARARPGARRARRSGQAPRRPGRRGTRRSGDGRRHVQRGRREQSGVVDGAGEQGVEGGVRGMSVESGTRPVRSPRRPGALARARRMTVPRRRLHGSHRPPPGAPASRLSSRHAHRHHQPRHGGNAPHLHAAHARPARGAARSARRRPTSGTAAPPSPSAGGMMLKAAEILETEKEAFGRLMVTEMGKPIKAAVEEAAKCALGCRYYAEHAERFLADETDRDQRHPELGRLPADRSGAGGHALELPLLAGVPLRRAGAHGRQRRAAQARLQRAAVRARHRGHLPPRRLRRRAASRPC